MHESEASFGPTDAGCKPGLSRLAWLVPVGLGGALLLSAAALVAIGGKPVGTDPFTDKAPVTPASGSATPKAPQVGSAAVAPDRDPQAVELENRLTTDVQPLLQKYCYECHGGGKSKGGVALDGPGTLDAVLAMADDWDAAVAVLNDRLMPPEDKPQPTQHEVLTIQQWVDEALDYYPADAEPDPGWYTIHRLNRSEYRNTLRDLLGIDPAEHDLAEDLPPDNTGYGFDNNADVLSMSALQIEKYLDAADRAVELAFGQDDEGHGDRPRPLRKLERRALGEELNSGGQYMWANGSVFGQYNFTRAGTYHIQLSAWETPAGNEGARLRVEVGDWRLGFVEVTAQRGDPGTYTLEAEIDEPGEQTVRVSFINDTMTGGQDRNVAVENISVIGPLVQERGPTDAHRAVFFVQPNADDDGNRLPGTDGRRRLTESAAARQIIERFASRAFRRPARASEVVALLGLYRDARREGDDYEQAVKLAITATLVSPNFLYRAIDRPQAAGPDELYTLSDYELASRLSYFLWSSMPDRRLLDLAERDELSNPDTLRQEVRRMLVDPKSAALVENFTGQWLLLRNLETKDVDPNLFPEYTEALRSAMKREAELFFDDILREDRSVLNLLSSEYTYLNGVLAEHYGIDGVRGEAFMRVNLPADSPRGGVLTMAATLTVTSHPNRTSPVQRGQYVLDQLLGTPLPPPPPDVPPLEIATDAVGENATLREQLAAHVADPNCAVCHRRLDPIGLAMENFTATGAWRDREGGSPIDAAGVLPGGERFDGPVELKVVLMQRQELFVENLTRKMLTYALGRGIEPFDRPTIKALTESVASNDYRMSALLEAIVLSDSFLKCRSREGHE